MAIASSSTQLYTVEEYLDRETQSDIRSEYRNGEIIPMTGGTPAHNKIISALNALLWFGLRGQAFSLFASDQRLWIPNCNLYTYPDVMVVANPLDLQAGRTDTVTNPILVAEVLSKSTKDYDRDEKFSAYRTIDTFTEYLLIDQYQQRVEQYVRQEANQWLLTVHEGQAASISLASVPVEITLTELYETVELKSDG
ncbi:hypothetical protein C1752_02779 [Acaryochloris thomasi RCC1774]|uniref:Putative restriction endonuclease domain-containing protein n=1 Tax=Acaryochloris thomasi RCC1774 TaxID=1764569 RepID=A0A2W1JXS2_9CYAN|nr:Uma2 family endonuclease [Acaryochloris thomasi]PZD73067.1 hypothetical protein C1752_02779 [Acaryochloris thomasi RCC1774]